MQKTKIFIFLWCKVLKICLTEKKSTLIGVTFLGPLRYMIIKSFADPNHTIGYLVDATYYINPWSMDYSHEGWLKKHLSSYYYRRNGSKSLGEDRAKARAPSINWQIDWKYCWQYTSYNNIIRRISQIRKKGEYNYDQKKGKVTK